MELKELREHIDGIDHEIVRLFTERMDVCAEIARWKEENNARIRDVRREREKLREVEDLCPEELRHYVSSLYSLIMDLSKSWQVRTLARETELTSRIRAAVADTGKLFPERAAVACQGIEGANSQLACERLFRSPMEFYFSSFEAVFAAIDKGLCRYGVLPLENSTAGSVNAVYDLMNRYDFRIVRSVRLKVDHSLLALPGTDLKDVREIFSHEQAIAQCSGFLSGLENVKVTPCANTAVAAKMVAESGRRDAAALAPRRCAELYGLSCLASSVQDRGNNFTRFICISRELEIYPGADRTSLMMILPHEPGALYKALSRFYALGGNLTKLESRPIPERDFEFMFYFDLQNSVYDPRFLQLMSELGDISEEYRYLGSYSEIV